jgi:hypothetical protein
MKSLFGCLLCLVLGTAQSFALKGGPDFGSQVRTTGIYAGIMVPGPLSPGANSIGLFSVTIPSTGLGTGQVVIFEAGQTYTGTFLGIADPDSAALTGEIDASFPFVEVVPSGTNTTGVQQFTTITVVAKAAGKLEGQIRANRNLFSTANARIVGTANIEFSLSVNNPFTQIAYIVLGFKQQDI